MKREIILILIALFTLSSCYVNKHPHGHVPPGQAKKIHGEKSAKRYAPGQQKKQHKKGSGHHKHSVYLY